MENLKAMDIRVGNYYDHNGDYKQVTPNTITEIWEAERSWCKPIPLTEEILLKCGAECYKFDNGEPNQYRLNSMLIVIRYNIFYDYGSSIKLEYLHDLQNVYYYKSNKTELTIKL